MKTTNSKIRCGGMLVILILVLGLAGSASAWNSVDVGTPTAGSASYDEATATWTVTGNGDDIWGTADNFHFVYKYLKGDGEIIARVANFGFGSDPWAKAGVMIRDMLNADSKFAAAYVTPGYGCSFQARLVTAGSATSDNSVATDEQKAIVAPYWVKLERVGNAFNTYYCNDPSTDTWHLMVWSPQKIAMADPVYIGLAVTSRADGELRTVTFDNMILKGGIYDVQLKAHNPYPADGAEGVPVDATLSWTTGDTAATHDVYFGTVFDDVNDASRDNDPNNVLVSQNQNETNYEPISLFEFVQRYYWRVDEFNDLDPNSPWKGNVWSFVSGTLTAYRPSPVLSILDITVWNELWKLLEIGNCVISSWSFMVCGVPLPEQDMSCLLDPLLDLSTAATERIFSEVFPCGDGPAGLTVCASSEPPPSGRYVLLIVQFEGDIPLNDETHFYQYAFVFDADGLASNNYEPWPDFPNDFFAYTDKWYELAYNPGSGWQVFVTDVRKDFAQVQSDARFVIAGAELAVFIPLDEFDTDTPTFRATAFGHTGDFGMSGGPWSGDYYPLVGEPLLPVAGAESVIIIDQ